MNHPISTARCRDGAGYALRTLFPQRCSDHTRIPNKTAEAHVLKRSRQRPFVRGGGGCRGQALLANRPHCSGIPFARRHATGVGVPQPCTTRNFPLPSHTDVRICVQCTAQQDQRTRSGLIFGYVWPQHQHDKFAGVVSETRHHQSGAQSRQQLPRSSLLPRSAPCGPCFDPVAPRQQLPRAGSLLPPATGPASAPLRSSRRAFQPSLPTLGCSRPWGL